MLDAATIAKALGGHRQGKGWQAQCPAHDDRTPSLSIHYSDDGNLLVHCHAGCAQRDVIAALQAKGLWPQNGHHPIILPRVALKQDDSREEAQRTAYALKLWEQSQPAQDTAVEAYLASRCLHGPVPASLRFNPSLKHKAGGHWPAMVAKVVDPQTDYFKGIHRTYLAQDGKGKAPVSPAKMMLGPCGGGVVKLAEAGEQVMIGEGIETSLTCQQACEQPAWAALSAGAMGRLSLPSSIQSVTILADNDPTGLQAAKAAELNLKRKGHNVRIAYPPVDMDFNDLMQKASQ